MLFLYGGLNQVTFLYLCLCRSISADLLVEAVKFARQYTNMRKEEEEVIFQARESLLFENERAWMKREKDTLFDMICIYIYINLRKADGFGTEVFCYSEFHRLADLQAE